MERDGLLINEKVGRTRVYQYNPRYPFVPEVRAMMEKVLELYPEDIKKELLYNRRRPRKKDKPL